MVDTKVDTQVEAKVGHRLDARLNTMTASDVHDQLNPVRTSTLTEQREAWRSAREGGQAIERDRGMREGGARERGQSMDREVGMRERRLSIDRERGARERGLSVDRERPARERGLSVDRERPVRERELSVDRERPVRGRGLSIDRETPARERGQSVDRERGRRELGSGDWDRGRASEREPRSGGTSKAREDMEAPSGRAMDRGRGETEPQSGERAGRGRGGRVTPSERGTRGPHVVAQESTSTTEDSKSHNALPSSETQKPSIRTPMHPAEDTPLKGTKDPAVAPRGRTPIQPLTHVPQPPTQLASKDASNIQPHAEPSQDSKDHMPSLHTTQHAPRDRNAVAGLTEASSTRAPATGGSGHAQTRSPEKEPPIAAERHHTRPASRPEISALADYARLRVLPEREDNATDDDASFPVSLAYLRQRAPVTAETPAEPSLEAFTADKARREAEANMARVLRYREREKHAVSRTPEFRRSVENHATPASAVAAKDHGKAGAPVGQLRQPITEHKLSELELRQQGLLTPLAQPPQIKGRRRGASLPREAIRDRSMEREFYHQPIAATQRGRPGVPRNASPSAGVAAVERGQESRPQEPQGEAELESEPLQYYSVSSQEPEPKPSRQAELGPNDHTPAHTHTKHTHILQPNHERLPAPKHTLQPAYDPAGPKHTAQHAGRNRGNENGFIQDYPAPMKDENGFTSDYSAVTRNDSSFQNSQNAPQGLGSTEGGITQNALPATGRGEGVFTQPLVDHGRSKVIVAPRSNPTSPALGKPTMFNVKDNTFRVGSVTKAVKPRLHRSISESLRAGSPRQGAVERLEDIAYLPTDPDHAPRANPSPQPHPIAAFHQPSLTRDSISHDSLPPAESPAPRELLGRFRRSLVLDEDDTRSLASALSEDVDGYGDLSEVERPESACSLSSQPGRPPVVPPKSEKALRRAKRLTSRRLKKAEAKAVASVPSSPTQVLSAPLQLPQAPPQYQLSAGYAPTATGVVSPPFSVAQRRLLQDPNSGQYFMVDVPLPTVKTKTFFDPQTGKYVRLNVRQPPEAALSPPQYMMYPGYLPMPISSLPARRSSSQMSAPATLMQEQQQEEQEQEAREEAREGSGAPWGPEVEQQQQQQQQRSRRGERTPQTPQGHARLRQSRQGQPEEGPLYKEHRHIITMSELEDFAMENA